MGKVLGQYIEKLMVERENDLINRGVVKAGRKLSRNYMAKEVLKVSGTWFSGVINGDNEPSDEMLIRIANFFEIEERIIFLVAERIHPEDYEKIKNNYLKELKSEFDQFLGGV